MKTATTMVMMSGIRAARVNSPKATRIPQTNSAKTVSISDGVSPIPIGSMRPKMKTEKAAFSDVAFFMPCRDALHASLIYHACVSY